MVEHEVGVAGLSKHTKLPDPYSIEMHYDRQLDTLSIYVVPKRPAVSIALDDHIWARYDPATDEVVGFEIENFKHTFLREHPDLARVWPHRGRLTLRHRPTSERRFLDSALQFLSGFFYSHPRKLSFSP